MKWGDNEDKDKESRVMIKTNNEDKKKTMRINKFRNVSWKFIHSKKCGFEDWKETQGKIKIRIKMK